VVAVVDVLDDVDDGATGVLRVAVGVGPCFCVAVVVVTGAIVVVVLLVGSSVCGELATVALSGSPAVETSTLPESGKSDATATKDTAAPTALTANAMRRRR
jgi:hypothetical protein